MALPHCPHCLLPIHTVAASPWPPAAERCIHCRLIIGAGRARHDAEADGDARSRGTAAGVLANAAKRQGSAPSERSDVAAALCATAGMVGTPVERLRMLDYQKATEGEPTFPDLSSVLATYGTWKTARAAAADSVECAVEAA